MGRVKTVRIWLPAVLLVLVGVLILAAGLFDRQQVFELTDFLRFLEGRRVSTAQGNAYGSMQIDGTALNLPAGDYRLVWQVAGDGERALTFSSRNDAEISPDTIRLSAGETAGETLLHVGRGTEGFTVNAQWLSGTMMQIDSLRLSTPSYKDNAVTLLLILIGASALWVCMGYGLLHREQAGMLVLIGLAVMMASVTAFKETLNIGHDTAFHLARIENLAEGLRSGQFPVRMGGYSYNGFGAITSVFYGDVFLYPFALLRIGGASPTYVMNLLMVSMNALSALTMYQCAKRILGDRWMGACAAILYVLSLYRATNAYSRCAVGEVMAMAMIPLFLLGLWEVVYGERRSYRILALGATGIFLSHMLSTLICGLTAGVFCLAHGARIVREKRLLPIVKAAALTGLLCAFQLLPFLDYSMQGIGAQAMVSDVAYKALEPASLFLLGQGTTIAPRDPHLIYFAVEIGFSLLLFAALALYAALIQRERGLKERAVFFCVGGGMLFAVCCTTLFPWGYLSALTDGLSNYLQFAWRLLMMVTVLFALIGGYGAVRAAGRRPDAAAVAALCAAALCVLPTLSRETRYDELTFFGAGGSPNLIQPEYLLPDTELAWTLDHTVYMDGDVLLTDYQKQGTQVDAQVAASSDAVIRLPLFGFDGFAAEVDGERMQVGVGDMNRLTVSLPAGTQGRLHVWFAGKGYWRITDGISLLTLVCLCVGAVRRRRGLRQKAK